MTHANLAYVQVPVGISGGAGGRSCEEHATSRFIPDVEKSNFLQSHVDVRYITLNTDYLGLFLKIEGVSEITSTLYGAFPRHGLPSRAV
jgi:hypothetical protein